MLDDGLTDGAALEDQDVDGAVAGLERDRLVALHDEPRMRCLQLAADLQRRTAEEIEHAHCLRILGCQQRPLRAGLHVDRPDRDVCVDTRRPRIRRRRVSKPR